MPPKARNVWLTSLALGGAIDAIVSMAIVSLFSSDSEFWLLSFFTFLILQGASVLIGLIALGKAWIMYFLFIKDQGERGFLDLLIQEKFPHPERYLFDNEEFLSQVSDNDAMPAKTRTIAAAMLGRSMALQEVRPFTIAMFEGLCLSKAIDRYREMGTTVTLNEHSPESHHD